MRKMYFTERHNRKGLAILLLLTIYILVTYTASVYKFKQIQSIPLLLILMSLCIETDKYFWSQCHNNYYQLTFSFQIFMDV